MNSFSLNNSGPRSVLYKNLLVVDPNPAGTNMVNTEDLNISVELKVFKRDEDIIVSSESNVQVQKGDNSDTTLISFIDGSGDDGKYLTTHYTELNTNFNKENPDLGTLGIESVDISFNASYTPIVKIKFKDIRGKLFQMGNDSPYSFLFRMPYPIFYLTVKGYYGKPVEYALHLTKFSGSLNSDSGDFMIDCDFIGYSYAFLSDMLMGLIKVGPFTDIGSLILNEDENNGVDKLITFDDLLKIISELETKVIDYKKNDFKLKALGVYDILIDKINEIQGVLPNLLEFNGDAPTDLPNPSSQTEVLVSYTNDNDRLQEKHREGFNKKIITLIGSYNDTIDKATSPNVKLKLDFKIDVDKYDLNNELCYYNYFKLKHFVTLVDGTYKAKTLTSFQKQNIIEFYENFKLESDGDGGYKPNGVIEKLYSDFVGNILKQPPFYNNNKFNTSQLDIGHKIMDLRFLNEELNQKKSDIKNTIKTGKNLVTNDFTSIITKFFDGLPYDGSIGRLFEILCDHVDLFMRILRDLGANIKKDEKSGKRNVDSTNIKNIPTVSNGSISISPFPEYVEDEDGALVEKWLGIKFPDFREVQFIENLYSKIISKTKEEIKFIEDLEKIDLSWYPVNPLETIAFDSNNQNPWESIKNDNELVYFKTILRRMIIFMSYSNKILSESEIINMAKIEANQAFSSIVNSNVKNNIINGGRSDESIKNRIIALSERLKGKEDIYLDEIEDSTLTYINPNDPIRYDDDNEYIKIIDNSTYENITTKHQTFINSQFSNITKGFNGDVLIEQKNDMLGGKLKTHEFITYEKNDIGEIPLFYEFYDEKGVVDCFFTEFKGDNVRIFNEDGSLVTDDISLIDGTKPIRVKNMSIKTLEGYYNKTSLYDYLVKNKDNNFTFNPTFELMGIGDELSLFGSKFYYAQTNSNKALLFLHTIPFNGLSSGNFGLLTGKEINFFNQRAGLISVPYSWVLFLGGIIKRLDGGDNFIYEDTNNNQLLTINNDNIILVPPTNEEYLSSSIDSGLSFNGGSNTNAVKSNKQISSIIKFLPQSVKNQIMDEFTNWVDNGWGEIKNEMEIFNDNVTTEQINDFWDNFDLSNDILKSDVGLKYDLLYKNKLKGNFTLGKKIGGSTDIISNFIMTNKIIINNTYRIWDKGFSVFPSLSITPLNSGLIFIADDKYTIPFKVGKTQVNTYLTTFFKEFSSLNNTNANDVARNKAFNSNDIDDIKLSLYKNVKSIYDKWVVGIPEGQKSVIVRDLYSRFNFIDRSFTDVSKKVKIAPTTFKDLWSQNSNVSFYTFIASILKDNNFDFIPLPTYINYNSPKEVSDIFRTFDYNTVTDESQRGPQFVCMYFGERSNKLNLDGTGSFKNDGFSLDVRDGNLNEASLMINEGNSTIPKDFNADNENRVPYVLVNYADQNQSIFKNYKLDQNEFTETQESLEIIERLSYGNKNSSIGQNLFDIYNNRAYSAEIEMLGCAQIQPFMYFQLNNIPMFDGAYSIINTTHHIKPNHMTTTFKGVRIRSVKTKMIDNKTLYAHLLNDLSDVNSNSGDISKLRDFEMEKLLEESKLDIDPKLIGSFSDPLPLNSNGKIIVTSDFGIRTINSKLDYHGGIDFRAAIGTDVKAVTDLTVYRIKWNVKNPSSGLYVDFKVDDADYYVRYMHLSGLTHSSLVKLGIKENGEIYPKGIKIKSGTIFAKTGKTGTDKEHLHMDIRKGVDITQESAFKFPQKFFKPESTNVLGWSNNQNKQHN